MWLANVERGMPLRMSKPDHVLATLAQLKYLSAEGDACVEGLLGQLGLQGERAEAPADGNTLLGRIASGGDGMYLLVTEGDGTRAFAVPRTMAFLRRSAMTYFFDPANGLFEYGPLQHHLMERTFSERFYGESMFALWTVRSCAPADGEVAAPPVIAARRSVPADGVSH
ncbi:MAG: hypothetical protein AAGF49_09075 [Pseudomonadota bacterium]